MACGIYVGSSASASHTTSISSGRRSSTSPRPAAPAGAPDQLLPRPLDVVARVLARPTQFPELELQDSQVEEAGPANVGRDELARRLDSGEEESQVPRSNGRLRGGVLSLEDMLQRQVRSVGWFLGPVGGLFVLK